MLVTFSIQTFFRKFVKRKHLSRCFPIARSILRLNSDGYAAKEKDVHFTAFKVIATEAVLLNNNNNVYYLYSAN